MDNPRQFLKSDIGICVALYLRLGIAAWLLNGVFTTHFVIKDLTDIFIFAFGQLSIKHGIDSAFNSPRGEPMKQQGGVQ